MNVDIVNLEGKDYYFVKKVLVNDTTYCYFSNVNDNYDLCVRKLVLDNGEYYFVGLDNQKEVLFALEHFDD